VPQITQALHGDRRHPCRVLLLLGFATGLALVAPIGPVALTLFGLGAERGRRAALAGAGGVVLGDLVCLPLALGGAGLVAGLDAGVVRGFEVAMGAVLIGLAMATLLATDRARTVVAGIRRPTRALALMTVLNPLSLVAWAGLALALPPSLRAPGALLAFGAGILLASAVWHSGLAVAAGTLARRAGDRHRRVVTRASGLVLLAVGGLLVA
jgi:threonine/homoserine/homoserine lactone efflux protein